MTLEPLDCWDDYPMEHGCICGNDCAPPSLPLDPKPYAWVDRGIEHRIARTKPEWDVPPNHNPYAFCPRPGYSQNREDYASWE